MYSRLSSFSIQNNNIVSNQISGSIIRLEILPGAFSRNFIGNRSSVPSPRFSTSTMGTAESGSGSRRALLYPPTPNTVQPHRKCARYRSMSEIDRFVFPSSLPTSSQLPNATPTLGVRGHPLMTSHKHQHFLIIRCNSVVRLNTEALQKISYIWIYEKIKRNFW